MEENGPGAYRAWMEGQDLVPSRSYRVRVTTPTGQVIMSDFDKLTPCPEVDSIYYTIEEIPTNDPDRPERGLRFYTDLDARGYEGRFFRWEVEETWEYHMDYYRQ